MSGGQGSTRDDAPQGPRSPEKTRFRLHWVAALGMGVYAVLFIVEVVLAAGAGRDPTVATMTGFAARFGAGLFWALVLGLVAFFVSRRSNLVAALVFSLVLIVMYVIGLTLRDRSPGPDTTRAQAAASPETVEAAVRRAAEAWTETVKDVMGSYHASLARLSEAGGVAPASLETPEAIDERITMVDALNAANERVIDAFNHSAEAYGEALKREGLSAAQCRDAVKGFNEGLEATRAGVLAIRELDRRLGKHMHGVLAVLKTHWGHWTSDAATGAVAFDDSVLAADARSFQEHWDGIGKAADEQARLTQQILQQERGQ